jgi:predicted amidophosphoribosyltransferase
MCGCMLMHAAMGHSSHDHEPVHSAGRCVHCDFPLQKGFSFCPSCGMRLSQAACPACGQQVEPSWKSCAFCGSPLAEMK